ncbi:response regulator [Ralstonia pseudosolanacearum]|uniref:response regulator transcription factor n=1 Tax=Ralstonia pseudosolanacearum TaxID=1310165 RepID=UPI0006BDF432|nr:response regulator transcription factor [Ralstonia pseudosolanacearum]AKZ25096.1 LuxR family transcriptional regulator [Ralstonia solanacearum]MBX9428499.1 response regulator transcription factor [Ralstonia pseudosolanacearum]BCL90567.1 DNA-binding response regulator [Ralstonia solanacearum]BCL95615.1 DNA-binding response regulator [Ralstonia solanacearum]BCM10877.1 DNA-binding response regulator [Ralstonia solanacearum]
MSPFLSIVAADDHPVILMGLATAIQQFPRQKIIAQAHDGHALLALLESTDCDVVVTDYHMNGDAASDGMQLLTRLRARHPQCAVVVCTMVCNPALLRCMQQLGVRRIVSKRDDLAHVGHAVAASARGLPYYSPTIVLEGGFGIGAREAFQGLSAREREVVSLYVSGMAVSEIASRLGSSIKTVSTQKTTALRKLGLARETDLFQYVRTAGLPALH